MKRFSIGMTDEEYERLERMQSWYSAMTGVRVSKCSLIKVLLFESWNEKELSGSKTPPKSFKTPSKPDHPKSLSASSQNAIYRETVQTTE